MILLDTNVVSEIMKVAPARAVLEWLNEREAAELFLSTVTVGEVVYGLEALPEGRRRAELTARFERFVSEAFEERICDYDVVAARSYGSIMARRKAMGRPMSVPDGQIAAVAHARGYAVATRNVRDFEGIGLRLVDPFSR